MGVQGLGCCRPAQAIKTFALKNNDKQKVKVVVVVVVVVVAVVVVVVVVEPRRFVGLSSTLKP